MTPQERDDRRRMRAARKIFEGWIETARGQRWLRAKNPGVPSVSLDTGNVTVRRRSPEEVARMKRRWEMENPR